MYLLTRSALVLLLFSITSFSSLGQDTDLKTWYETFFASKKSSENALAEGNAKLEEALEIHDLPAEAHARMEMGLIHLTRTQDFEKAMDFFIHSLLIEDSLKLLKEQAITRLAIGQLFEEVKDYPKSAESLEQALLANRQSGDDPVILVMILNKLGKINALQGKNGRSFRILSTGAES